jgi:superfamily I DNA/RNA helicase
VGDPKQNIMAFAGATDDIFELLTEKFFDCVKMEIAISFRVPQEIAAVANDFTSKFMPYKPKLVTNKGNGGKKPVIFIAGEKKDYKLTSEDKKVIGEKAQQIVDEAGNLEMLSAKKERKFQRLQKKLTDEQIKNRKLEEQMNFILSVINKLDRSFSRVILFRKNETGN